MQQPDTNTIVIIIFNCIVYLAVYMRRGRKESKEETKQRALMIRQHNEMYADYAEKHGIKKNGGIQEA